MSKQKKTIIKLVIFAALLAGFYFGYSFWMKKKQMMMAAAMANMVVEVNVVTVASEEVQLTQELPGRVAAYKISEVRPQIDGTVRKIKFEEGSFVKAGTQLYEINPAVYQAAFDDAKANLKTTQSKKNRYKALLKVEGVSKQEYDDINAALAKAKSDYKKAKQNLDYSKVAAPISGYIGKSNVTEGAIVTANQAMPLTTITELDPLYVDMVQPSKDSLKIGDQKNITVSLSIDGEEHEEKGKLKFTEVFADEGTDSVRLRAKFSNKNKKLIPGMFVNAKLHLKPIKAITVPQRATIRNPDGSLMIWVVENGNVAKARMIKAEQSLDDKWIVLDGLQDGEIIVYEGFLKLADGAKVKPVAIEEKTKQPATN